MVISDSVQQDIIYDTRVKLPVSFYLLKWGAGLFPRPCQSQLSGAMNFCLGPKIIIFMGQRQLPQSPRILLISLGKIYQHFSYPVSFKSQLKLCLFISYLYETRIFESKVEKRDIIITYLLINNNKKFWLKFFVC